MFSHALLAPHGAPLRARTWGTRLQDSDSHQCPLWGCATRVTPSFLPSCSARDKLPWPPEAPAGSPDFSWPPHMAGLANSKTLRAFRITLSLFSAQDPAPLYLLWFGSLRCDVGMTQPASPSLSGAPGVGRPGGQAWLGLCLHQAEVCGLGSLVRTLQTGSGRADPSGRQERLYGQQGVGDTAHQQGWGRPNIPAAALRNY